MSERLILMIRNWLLQTVYWPFGGWTGNLTERMYALCGTRAIS